MRRFFARRLKEPEINESITSPPPRYRSSICRVEHHHLLSPMILHLSIWRVLSLVEYWYLWHSFGHGSTPASLHRPATALFNLWALRRCELFPAPITRRFRWSNVRYPRLIVFWGERTRPIARYPCFYLQVSTSVFLTAVT